MQYYGLDRVEEKSEMVLMVNSVERASFLLGSWSRLMSRTKMTSRGVKATRPAYGVLYVLSLTRVEYTFELCQVQIEARERSGPLSPDPVQHPPTTV